MSTVVFLGPTLPLTQAKSILPDAWYHAPVQCGDILRVMRLQPKNIAIIDGYFDHTASVWHKEILWALSQGIQVYGASSMGALRAAELNTLGMRGIGKIYENFANQTLTDDDEVAILHSDEKFNYTPLTDALVNIRSTLTNAVNQHIIDNQTASQLLAHAKNTHYSKRRFDILFSDHPQLLKFIKTHGPIDQKQEDAKLLLQTLAQKPFKNQTKITAPTTKLLNTLRLKTSCTAFAKNYEWLSPSEILAYQASTSEHYKLFQQLARGLTVCDALNISLQLINNHDTSPQTVAQQYLHYIENTLYELIVAQEIKPNIRSLQIYSDRFRHQQGLHNKSDMHTWLEKQSVDQATYTKFIEKKAIIDLVLSRGNLELFNQDIQVQDHFWLLEALKLTGFVTSSKTQSIKPAETHQSD